MDIVELLRKRHDGKDALLSDAADEIERLRKQVAHTRYYQEGFDAGLEAAAKECEKRQMVKGGEVFAAAIRKKLVPIEPTEDMCKAAYRSGCIKTCYTSVLNAAPEWKFVPIEPTPKMVKEGIKWVTPEAVYEAMLEAAPAYKEDV